MRPRVTALLSQACRPAPEPGKSMEFHAKGAKHAKAERKDWTRNRVARVASAIFFIPLRALRPLRESLLPDLI